MTQKELSELTDQELLDKAKKMKSTKVIGLVTLIPLFFIYKMVNKSTDDIALKNVLKERDLD